MNENSNLNAENASAPISASDNGNAANRTATPQNENAVNQLSASDTRRAEFERLISGEYNDLFTERVSGIINRRFAENKRTEASRLKERRDRLNTELRDAATDFTDRSLLAADEAEKVYADWLGELDSIKADYPDFAVEAALKNPSFGKLLLSGLSLRDAYEASHLDAVRAAIRSDAAKDAEARTLDRIRLNGLRPDENGAGGGSGVITGGMASLSRAERAELARKAMRGLL